MRRKHPKANDERHRLSSQLNAVAASVDPQSAGADVGGDVERYLCHLAQIDMPLSAKIELIRVLRGIMQSFVDRAFGDDPVQILEKSFERNNINSGMSANMLELTRNASINSVDLMDTFQGNGKLRKEKATDL